MFLNRGKQRLFGKEIETMDETRLQINRNEAQIH
jgi:hypothetical protein